MSKQLSQDIYSFEKERANFPGRNSGRHRRDRGLQINIAGDETWLPQRLLGPQTQADATLLLWDTVKTHYLSRIASHRQTDPDSGAVHKVPGNALESVKVREDQGRRRNRPRVLGDATMKCSERPRLGSWTGGHWWESW